MSGTKQGLERGSRSRRLAMRARDFLLEDLWSPEVTGLPTFRAFLYRLSRIVVLVQRGYVQHRCPFHAAALTYITVLSLVPFLAFVFSVAKGLGAYDRLLSNTILPFLDRTFGGGAGGTEASQVRAAIEKVLEFVQSTNLSSLGIFGLALLLYTVVKLLGNIEASFNEIWGVRRSRSLARKLSDYVAMVVVTPILLTTATGITTAAKSERVTDFLESRLGIGAEFQFLLNFVLPLMPMVVIWFALGFLYLTLPNTRPKLTSAVIGGIVGGTVWQVVQIVHVTFQIGMAKYNALYSGFAAIPLFMIWIFLSWNTVLLGAEVAAAHEREPSLRGAGRLGGEGQTWRERVALRACVRIAAAFAAGRRPLPLTGLAQQMGVSQRQLQDVLTELVTGGVLVRSQGRGGGHLPARDLDLIRVTDVLAAMRSGSLRVDRRSRSGPDERADAALAALREELEASPHNRTLRALVAQEERGAPALADPGGAGVPLGLPEPPESADRAEPDEDDEEDEDEEDEEDDEPRAV